MKYYSVKTKCGHVRKSQFTIQMFYIKAENKKEAAKKARNKPRVKHHRKDAIIEVKEISMTEYFAGLKGMLGNPYFQVHSSSEQRRLCPEGTLEIFKEEAPKKYKKKRNGQRIKNWNLSKEKEKEARSWMIDE